LGKKGGARYFSMKNGIFLGARVQGCMGCVRAKRSLEEKNMMTNSERKEKKSHPEVIRGRS